MTGGLVIHTSLLVIISFGGYYDQCLVLNALWCSNHQSELQLYACTVLCVDEEMKSIHNV